VLDLPPNPPAKAGGFLNPLSALSFLLTKKDTASIGSSWVHLSDFLVVSYRIANGKTRKQITKQK
jgi:hypothetical protein